MLGRRLFDKRATSPRPLRRIRTEPPQPGASDSDRRIGGIVGGARFNSARTNHTNRLASRVANEYVFIFLIG
jgi:hypothetical protein